MLLIVTVISMKINVNDGSSDGKVNAPYLKVVHDVGN